MSDWREERKKAKDRGLGFSEDYMNEKFVAPR
jgi:hypothetical protein